MLEVTHKILVNIIFSIHKLSKIKNNIIRVAILVYLNFNYKCVKKQSFLNISLIFIAKKLTITFNFAHSISKKHKILSFCSIKYFIVK